MVNLKENINNFSSYLDKIRGYSKTSILSYENILNEVNASTHHSEDEKKPILNSIPLRLKSVNNSKKTISKKLSNMEVKLIGDSVIKLSNTLIKPISWFRTQLHGFGLNLHRVRF